MSIDMANEKFYKYQEKMVMQDENISLITYYKERYVYILKNKIIPIDAMKIWVDKGTGLEERIEFKDSSDTNTQNIAMIIKDGEKLVFKDQCEQFYAFGIGGVKSDLKKLVAFIKSGSGDMIVFASAETNSIEILMKHIRLQNDAILECLFERQTNPVTKTKFDGVDLNEIFSC